MIHNTKIKIKYSRYDSGFDKYDHIYIYIYILSRKNKSWRWICNDSHSALLPNQMNCSALASSYRFTVEAHAW